MPKTHKKKSIIMEIKEVFSSADDDVFVREKGIGSLIKRNSLFSKKKKN